MRHLRKAFHALRMQEVLVITIITHNPNSIKPWGLVQIYEKDNKYVHVNCGTFFDQNTALREITKWQGKEWVGEDTIDDLC